jgi:hypothetical protein
VITQFTIDLTRPGRAHRSRWDWFVGDAGRRHMAILTAVGVALVAVVVLGGVIPRHLRHSSELRAIEALRREVAVAQSEESTLRGNLRDLGVEASRQIRWSELLPALSREVPDSIRIDRVSVRKPGRTPQGAQAQQPAQQTAKAGTPSNDLSLQIEASTSVAPGDARLVQVAKLMAALAQDPAVRQRFELKTWELHAGREQGREQEKQLQIRVELAEKRS